MASDFIMVGNTAIAASSVTSATWSAVPTNPLSGTIDIATRTRGFSLEFVHPDAEKVAKALGLGDFYDKWAAAVKDDLKAKAAAQARIDAKAYAEEEAAKAVAEEAAKHEAKILADVAKAESKAAHAAHAHK